MAQKRRFCSLIVFRADTQTTTYIFFVDKTSERILLHSFRWSVLLFKQITHKIYRKISKYLVNREASNQALKRVQQTRNNLEILSLVIAPIGIIFNLSIEMNFHRFWGLPIEI